MAKHRIVRNLLILVSGQIITWTISIAHLVLMSRYLGPVRLGEFVLAAAITMVLGLIAGLGMETYIVRAVAREPARSDTLVSAAVVARGGLLLLVPVCVFVYATLAHLNATTADAAYIMSVGIGFQQLSGLFIATFQGHERMAYSSINNVVTNLSQLGLTLLAILINGGVIAFAINNTLIAAAVFALNVRWSRPFFHLTVRIKWRDITELLRGSLAFSAGNLFQTFYTSIDSVILGLLGGSAPVAYYGAGSRLLTVPMAIPFIAGQVTLPLLSRLGIDPGRDFEQASRKTISLLIVTSVPLVVAIITFSSHAISLIFGARFDAAVPALMALACSVPFTFIDMQFYQVLAARDREVMWSIVMGVSCVLNPLINLALIPFATYQWHNPAIGAALSLTVTEGLMAIYGAYLLRSVVFHATVARTLAGTLIGGFLQGALLHLLGPLPLLPSLIAELAAGLVYVVAVLALGALPWTDVRYLLDVALRRPRRATV
ncbi:MAG TPA: flippase [Chloroflexota bacterium]|nr:flippase [Chloroflexota bacterium]